MIKTTKTSPVRLHKKIFLVEDHPVFREGLVQILNSEEDLQVCGTADNANQALRRIARLKPDLVLIDIGLPDKSGLELIKELRMVDRKIKLLVVSMHDEALYADRVLRAGGDGYIMKQEDPEEIVHAIRDILGGHIYVSEEVLTETTNGAHKGSHKPKARAIDKLSDSELEVLERLGRGASSAEIAGQLGLARPAVNAHCREIIEKLKLKHQNELIRYAVCWVEAGAA
jgi:DNA-binding NarL/FixJ family response regulator